MGTSKLNFWSGMAAMWTGILWMIWTVVPWTSLLAPALLLALPVIYSLQIRRAPEAASWSWLACMLGMAGAATGAATIVLIVRSAGASAGSLVQVALVGMVALAGGLALLGLASSRLIREPLMLGGSIVIYVGWFWLFMLNRPNPPIAIHMIWVVLGVIIGIGWGYLGQILLRDVKQVSTNRAN